jgi:polypeptide N-acetylgalactosaminyltransferase
MFLDSHCEVNVNWLEPLVARLSDYPFAAISPIIDVISPETLKYKASTNDLKGGFDWSLHFKWIPMSEVEREQREDESLPFVSPAVSGGIFLISRSWFHQLGGFDNGLEVSFFFILIIGALMEYFWTALMDI